MSPSMREQIRVAILRYLDAAADSAPGRGISTAVLAQHLRAEGFDAVPGDPDGSSPRQFTAASLLYLQGKGLVGQLAKAVSPEVAEWVITSAGRDEYARLAA